MKVTEQIDAMPARQYRPHPQARSHPASPRTVLHALFFLTIVSDAVGVCAGGALVGTDHPHGAERFLLLPQLLPRAPGMATSFLGPHQATGCSGFIRIATVGCYFGMNTCKVAPKAWVKLPRKPSSFPQSSSSLSTSSVAER